jgi:hypothetical protein
VILINELLQLVILVSRNVNQFVHKKQWDVMTLVLVVVVRSLRTATVKICKGKIE